MFRQTYDVKSIKFFLLLSVIIFGTLTIYLFKRDNITYEIGRYVKKNLPSGHDYKSTQFVMINNLDSVQLEYVYRVVKIRLKKSPKNLKLVYNKFMDQGHPYIVTLVLSAENKILFMDKPRVQ